MAKLFTATILLCLAATTFAATRIMGGRPAPDGKYPYQVSLKRSDRHFCGGSIINERWILTAAHCIEGMAHKSIMVVAGTNLLRGGAEENYPSEYVVWHKGFSMSNPADDIGLVRVDREIKFSEKVQPIKLTSVDLSKVGTPVVLTGWGSLMYGHNTPNNLQEITLQIYDQEKCQAQWQKSYNIGKNQICTLTKIGEGACSGDSGGPLVAGDVQVGIVSFGKPCGKGVPDVFTRVFSYLNWINEEMRMANHENQRFSV